MALNSSGQGGANHPECPVVSNRAATPHWHAETLTSGGGQALISLGDSVYTLRITRAGKLILTK